MRRQFVEKLLLIVLNSVAPILISKFGPVLVMNLAGHATPVTNTVESDWRRVVSDQETDSNAACSNGKELPLYLSRQLMSMQP